MIVNEEKPPTTRRRFTSPWIELDYLCKKIHYWLYTRGQKTTADRYVKRLRRVLDELPEKNNLAIARQEGLALLHQLKGDLSKSIVHRTREIELIERLRREAQLPRYDDNTRAYMLQDLDDEALQQRRDILQSLKEQKLAQNNNGKMH